MDLNATQLIQKAKELRAQSIFNPNIQPQEPHEGWNQSAQKRAAAKSIAAGKTQGS